LFGRKIAEAENKHLILAPSSFFRPTQSGLPSLHPWHVTYKYYRQTVSNSSAVHCGHDISTYHPFISLSSTTLRSTFCPFSVSLRTVALTCSLENPMVATFSTTSSRATLLPDEPAGVELTGSACGSIRAVGSLLP
jgi:hypothetical protein